MNELITVKAHAYTLGEEVKQLNTILQQIAQKLGAPDVDTVFSRLDTLLSMEKEVASVDKE